MGIVTAAWERFEVRRNVGPMSRYPHGWYVDGETRWWLSDTDADLMEALIADARSWAEHQCEERLPDGVFRSGPDFWQPMIYDIPDGWREVDSDHKFRRYWDLWWDDEGHGTFGWTSTRLGARWALARARRKAMHRDRG